MCSLYSVSEAFQPLVSMKYDSYMTLAMNMSAFIEYNALPKKTWLMGHLDNGNPVLQTLVEQLANLNEMCQNKCDTQKTGWLGIKTAAALWD